MLGISCRERKTNEYVWQPVNFIAGWQELFLPLDEAITSRAVIVIVSGSVRRTGENAFGAS